VLPQALFIAALAGLSVVGLIRRHPAGFVGAWFFVILAPTSSVLPVVTEVAAEHRMYLPLAAVVLAVVVGAYEAGRRARGRGPGAVRSSVVAAIVATAAVSVTFAEMTRARNRDYWSDEGLWLDTIQKRPANPQARIGYAINLLAAQRWAEAERELRVAIALEPRNGRAHMNLGSSLAAQGRIDEGIRHLELARDLAPHIHETWGLLAQAYQDQRRMPEAVAMYRRAVAVMPDNPFLLNSFAWVLATSADDTVRDGTAAVQHADRALQIAGGRPAVFLATLAAAQAEAGRLTAALATAREAQSRAAAEGDRVTAAELRWQLASYEAGRPVRIR
jgi:tetratricopeptide (TPR) repeat protein